VKLVVRLHLFAISSTLILSNQFILPIVFSAVKYGIILGVNSSNSKKIFNLQKKIASIAGVNLEILVKVCLRDKRS
jgi:uncharacterized membrane protein